MGEKHHRRAAHASARPVGVIVETLAVIADALRKRNLHAWQVRERATVSDQSFLALGDTECRRRAETTTYEIFLHVIRPARKESPAAWGGKVMGMASFKIGEADVGRLESKIDEALTAASLVENQPFALPAAPGQFSPVEICDDSLRPSHLLELEDRLRKAVDAEPRTRLSSAEFFANRSRTRLVNHLGLDLTQEETMIQLELVLLARDQDRENEYIDRFRCRYRQDFDVERRVATAARFAREASVAGLPKTGVFPVVLSEEPLDQLFSPLVAKASARLRYNRMVESDLGASVTGGVAPEGDAVTLWSNGRLPRAVGSSAFDHYGTPAQRVCLIRENRVAAFSADKRYADYLGIAPTGELRNLEMEPGSASYDSLLQPASETPLYHLQAFSAFEPNPITGAFSAEIRAGTEITRGGSRPIKGGSVSGVLMKALQRCRFSKELELREAGLLPKAIRFDALTIAGA